MKHTGKALNSTRMRTPGSGHTSRALGRTQKPGSGPRSKHSVDATGHSKPPKQLSKGGGTSAQSKGVQGNPRPRYTKRNTRGIPNAR